MRLWEEKRIGYVPNQDQNVIQHTALIFLGRWSIVLNIADSIVSAPDLAWRVLNDRVQSAWPIHRHHYNRLTFAKAAHVLPHTSK